MPRFYDDEKITQDYLSRNNVVFYPQTTDEARMIQQKLFDCGICWSDHKDKHVRDALKCTEAGMVSKATEGGVLYTGPSLDYAYVVKSLEDFGDFDVTATMNARELFLLSRIDMLSEKMDRIIDLLEPKTLSKSGLDLKPSGM